MYLFMYLWDFIYAERAAEFNARNEKRAVEMGPNVLNNNLAEAGFLQSLAAMKSKLANGFANKKNTTRNRGGLNHEVGMLLL